MIDHVKVTSSNIESIGYDKQNRTLEVKFKSGAVHAYAGVGADAHAALMRAKSKGKHFAAHIKDNFTTSKVRT